MAVYLGADKINSVIVANKNPYYQTNELSPPVEWVRPADWPNFDAIDLEEDFEGVYLTYDNGPDIDYPWAGFTCTMNTGQYTVAQGHMNGNTWVQDSTQNFNSGVYCRINYGDSTYRYVVFKITPAANNHIQQFYFVSIPAATLGTYALRQQQDQYCLERKGNLPYITTTVGSGEDRCFSTEWLQCDNTPIGHKAASISLAAAWYRSRHLKKIIFDNWHTEDMNVTSLDSTFCACFTIEELDLSVWNTSNWHVTSLLNTFSSCYSLKRLKIPWDTHNWGPSLNMQTTFQMCRVLEELDLSNWDMSNLNVTTLYATWYQCYHLRKLNVTDWDTSNWHVSSLQSAWDGCYNLIDIDLTGWNTTNWTVGRMDYCWRNNRMRKNFHDIENWNVSNWNIKQMNSAFEGCVNIYSLNLNNWNVSGWDVTTLASTWSNCQSMHTLSVGNWDTSNWVVTSLASTFNNCYALENTDFFNWNTHNWKVTTVQSMFYACWSLDRIDFTNWDTSQWALTVIAYMCGYCYNLKYADISNLNLSKVTVGNYGSNKTSYTSFMENYQLETLILPPTFAGHINLRYSYLLSKNALLDIFNGLPTALSGAAIVLTEMRYKLTTADIAIATGKGYTVS